MRHLKWLFLLALFALPAFSQPSSTVARHIIYAASLPATCSPNTGDVYFKTTATVGPYYCSAANTWTAMGGGSSGPTITCSTGLTCTPNPLSGVSTITNAVLPAGSAVTDVQCWASSSTFGVCISEILTAITAPSTPASGKGILYIDSTSKNIAVKDDAGVVKHGVQTDTGAANNYISAISDAGVISKSRPSCATLSDSGAGCSAAAGLSVSGPYVTDGTNYYGGPHNALLTRPVASDSAWVNQGAATLTGTTGQLVLYAPQVSGDQLRVRTVSIGANTTMTSQFACTARATDNISCFIGMRESGTGKMENMSIEMAATNLQKTSVNRWASATSFGSTASADAAGTANPQWVSYRVSYVAGSPGTVTFQRSYDDVNWITFYTEASTVAFTTGPDQFLFGAQTSNGTSGRDVYMSLYSWKLQ